MVAEDNRRQKRMMSGMNATDVQIALVDQGYHYQYMCNMLQLNNGNSTFSEIGHMAGSVHIQIGVGDHSLPILMVMDIKDLFVSKWIEKRYQKQRLGQNLQ
jgi:hypothetical protein